MDDISRSLKISKKTLYQHVSDKKDLVEKVFTKALAKDEKMCEDIFQNNDNPIDELIEITKQMSLMLTQMHPSIHYDLSKYYPEAWEKFHNYKKEFIYNCTVHNLEIGIKKKLYRKNLNVPILAKLYIAKIDITFDPSIFPVGQFNFAEVFMEFMRYHFHGIVSETGREYLIQRMKKENLNLY
ncbi:MAG: TetR/AcrR family transcriptional regulator [Flavobacteriales bacterium]|nr:TetR/AcrR family transcriptional regulator [Flavobacteriales bacterium]